MATRVLAFNAQKGGVGKTTAAVNVAASLDEMGHRVLLVDLDPQGDATSTVGIAPHDEGFTSFDYVLGSCSLEEAVRSTEFGRLHVLPVFDAAVDRIGVPTGSTPVEKRQRVRALADGFHARFAASLSKGAGQDPELALARRLTSSSAGRRHGATAVSREWAAYEFVVVDLPPQQVLPVALALSAADAVIIPTKVEAYSMRGFSRMLDTLSDIREAYNPGLRVLGTVATFAQPRTQTTAIYLDAIREASESLGTRMFDTVIPYRVQAIAAAGLGVPLRYYSETRRLAANYDDLAREILHALEA